MTRRSPFSSTGTVYSYNDKTYYGVCDSGEITETIYSNQFRTHYDCRVMSDYNSIIKDALISMLDVVYSLMPDVDDFTPTPNSDPADSFEFNSDYSQTRRVYDPHGFWS